MLLKRLITDVFYNLRKFSQKDLKTVLKWYKIISEKKHEYKRVYRTHYIKKESRARKL